MLRAQSKHAVCLKKSTQKLLLLHRAAADPLFCDSMLDNLQKIAFFVGQMKG
jgi:hypothetical protein